MLSHPVQELPWQYIWQDLLKHNSRYYLATVDLYSDFFEFGLQSSFVIEATKRVFVRHGSPTICLTDNGIHFFSEAYTQFSKCGSSNM